MAGVCRYRRDAIRVKVTKCQGVLQPEHRKFSVDPQITSFEVLQSILAKAFDIRGDFTVRYMTFDDYGNETFLSLLSDWDLDAAFLSAADPCLCLQVDLKPCGETSDDYELPVDIPRPQVRPQVRIPDLILTQVERTLNLVQRALNLGEEQSPPIPSQPPRPPLADAEFRRFLDPIGQVIEAKQLRTVVYQGGIEPSLRKVVWKHILNVYPEGMSGKERMDYMKQKAYEYQGLRDHWRQLVHSGQVQEDLTYVTGMVRKDVLRTDRHHKFYAGSDDNQNIASLFNILTTYALNHPTVSYCQGMSDLASPLLVTMGDEAHAYICFVALMKRLKSNFLLDGVTMTLKFQHLADGLLHYDPEFYAYLKYHQADDLLFCYRWLLLEMKREFAFEDALRMLEVLWSSLPQLPTHQDLPLYEQQFGEAPVSPIVKTPRENAYTKVCALRRQSSAVSLRLNQSLDETGRGCLGRGQTFASLDESSLWAVQQSIEPKTFARLSNRQSNVSSTDTSTRSIGRVSTPDMTASDSESSSDNGKSPRQPNIPHTPTKTQIHDSFDMNVMQSLGTDNVDIMNETKQDEMAQVRVVKNLNEFLSFKSRSGTKRETSSEDEDKHSSPDDSTEYVPMTTSMTRELHIEMESLDRSVFGPNPNEASLVFESLHGPLTAVEPPANLLTGHQLPEADDLNKIDCSTHCHSVYNSRNNTGWPTLVGDCGMSAHGDFTMEDDAGQPSLHMLGISVRNSALPELGEAIEPCTAKQALFDSSDGTKCNHILSKQEDSKQSSGDAPFSLFSVTECDSRLYRHNKNNGIVTSKGVIDVANVMQNEPSRPSSVTEPLPDSPKAMPCNTKQDETSNGPLTSGQRVDLEDLDSTICDCVLSKQDLPSEETLTQQAEMSRRVDDVFVWENPLRCPTTPDEHPDLEYDDGPPSPGSEVTEASRGQLPPPHEFGAGNPFLMFLCLTVLRQHRDVIMRNGMDYNEMAMHFDKMVRKHNVTRVLNQARHMFAGYLRQHNADLTV